MFVYSMNYKAARSYSHARNLGVKRQQDLAPDAIPRRPYYAPYDNNGMKKGPPYKGSRNLVWTSEAFKASEGNRPRSIKSPAVGTGRCVPNQPSISYSRGWGSRDKGSPKSRGAVCKFWIAGKCKKGEQCHFLHSWSSVPGLAMIASLDCHKDDIKGIALPQGSNKLCSVSRNGLLQVWDCQSGKSVHTTNLQEEAGSLISEGPWVFLGLPNAVKAFNIQTSREFHLNGMVVGQVNAMTVVNAMLFAGTSSGSISVWKATETESDPFTYLTSLEGHTGEVTCFAGGGQRLYSGSVDKTIKVWDLNSMQCIMTLRLHTDTITSLTCWDQLLLSSSLDGMIYVWATSEDGSLEGSLEVKHTYRCEHSVHALCGMTDGENKPIIFCSYENGTVSIIDLPSFGERGKMFSTHTIGTITIGPEGLLFSGDKSGQLRVWSLAGTKV